MKDAYKKADDVLLNAVRSIFDLVVNRGHINLDFADLKTAMSTRGYAMMGAGLGRGEDRARQAAEQAIRSPLLDNVNIINAKGVLINITGVMTSRYEKLKSLLMWLTKLLTLMKARFSTVQYLIQMRVMNYV